MSPRPVGQPRASIPIAGPFPPADGAQGRTQRARGLSLREDWSDAAREAAREARRRHPVGAFRQQYNGRTKIRMVKVLAHEGEKIRVLAQNGPLAGEEYQVAARDLDEPPPRKKRVREDADADVLRRVAERRRRSRGRFARESSPLIPDYRSTKLTTAGPAGGSNGALFMRDESGNRWVRKDYGGDRDRVATELLANVDDAPRPGEAVVRRAV